jgi:SAM-dependent methyltransferase
MASDIKKLMGNLCAAYDFTGKTILWVGAGAGQIAAYLQMAEKVIAIDNDEKVLALFTANIARLGLAHLFETVKADFYERNLHGDVVLFDFSLHEMADPAKALAKAKQMAPDVVIFDHWPESEWAYFPAEEDKVRKSWAAINVLPAKLKQKFMAEQLFDDYAALRQKLASQGEVSMTRIEKFRGQEKIVIPMAYGIAIL